MRMPERELRLPLVLHLGGGWGRAFRLPPVGAPRLVYLDGPEYHFLDLAEDDTKDYSCLLA